jgi:hypothetical protein
MLGLKAVTNLVVRKMPWEFDASVPFMWQPANPNFGLFCNAFTFIAVPFERYIVNAVRKAQDKLNEDPDVAAEADFVEEIEHRSSGMRLCQHINPNPWYRVRHIRVTFNHVGKLSHSVAKTFDEVVPFDDRGVSAQQLMSNSMLFSEFKYRLPGGNRRRARRNGPRTLFHAVPTSELVTMVWRLALSQTPHHDPADQPLPDWADTWMREYERGNDMTAFYPMAER